MSTNFRQLDPMQDYALKLFCLDVHCSFQEVPCADDPRGYVDVIGADPSESTTLRTGAVVSSIALFFDHISFLLPKADIGILITPLGDYLDLDILSAHSQSYLGKKVIKKEAFLDEIQKLENGGIA